MTFDNLAMHFCPDCWNWGWYFFSSSKLPCGIFIHEIPCSWRCEDTKYSEAMILCSGMYYITKPNTTPVKHIYCIGTHKCCCIWPQSEEYLCNMAICVPTIKLMIILSKDEFKWVLQSSPGISTVHFSFVSFLVCFFNLVLPFFLMKLLSLLTNMLGTGF